MSDTLIEVRPLAGHEWPLWREMRLAALADAPELEEVERAPAYDDDEDADESDGEERKAPPRGPAAKPEPEPEAPVKRTPRRRAAVVAHADRQSVLAAVLLARDLRLLEGVWIYPQDELMTFFRGVAEELARAAAVVEVQAAGAKEFEVEVTWSEKVIEVDGRPLFVEGMATAVAAGRPDLG